MTDPSRRLLLVHAHPDDETINNGATMARYAAEGATVTLVTCTLGEEGEILVPSLAHLAADRDDRLGEHRIGELTAATAALGVADVRSLGGPGRWRDSGMAGTAGNEHPRAFCRADLDEAATELAAVIREVRPQVLVTYDPDGGYGHPDHVQAHRVAMKAVALAADAGHRPDLGPAWAVAKVYWSCVPESVMREGLRLVRETADSHGFAVPDTEAPLPSMIVPDEVVGAAIDGTVFADAKRAALRAHATQVVIDGPFFALSNNLVQVVWGTEYYRLARGRPGPATDEAGREVDLFTGVA